MVKAQLSFLRVESITLVFRHCTCHHLTQTQPAALASHNRSTGTGSMSLYGHDAGTAVEGGFNSQL